MSNIPAFSSKELEKALKNLGFVIDKSKGKGGHYKAKCPVGIKVQPRRNYLDLIRHLINFASMILRLHWITICRTCGMWSQQIGNTVLTRTDTVCPDKDCQKALDLDMEEKRLKKEAIMNRKSLPKTPVS